MHVATAGGVAVIEPAKPCARCPIPNIDPETAIASPAVGDALQGDGQVLKVGQSVGADWRFD